MAWPGDGAITVGSTTAAGGCQGCAAGLLVSALRRDDCRVGVPVSMSVTQVRFTTCLKRNAGADDEILQSPRGDDVSLTGMI
ncbi:hypothetical protein AC244_22505 [Ensifer adhaerens]|uniref:Uncharacterized protein n=1 Tax=Ensifer adhaerens TaxID=106592 RepID=A0A0L8BLS1_ENSAD|nr:hypothetical protein AC244_22505 [Ensifer adhaerens]